VDGVSGPEVRWPCAKGYHADVMIPEFIRRPLKGMRTGLGRFVLRMVKLAGISVAATFVFLVLDATLLRGVESET